MTEPTTMQSVKQGVRKFNLAASDTFKVASTRISRSDTKSLDRALVKATTAQRHAVPKPKHVAKLVAAASSNHRDLAYVVSETLGRLHGATDWLTALKSLVLLHQLMEGAPGVLDELVLISEADRRSAAASVGGAHSAAAQGFGSPDSLPPGSHGRGSASQALSKGWDASKKYSKKALEAVTAAAPHSARAASGETGPCRVDNFMDTRTLEGRFDYSEFVRAYGRYLDGQVACYAALRWAPVASAGEAPFRGLGTQDLLRALPALERLQNRLLDVAPRGAAAGDPVTTAALAATVRESFRLYRAVGEGVINLADRYFGMGKVDAIRALECYREAAASTDALSAYYARLDASGTLAGVGPMPALTPPPPEFLQSMETYAESAPEVGEQEPPITARLPDAAAAPLPGAGPDEYGAQLAAQAAQQHQLQNQMAQQAFALQQHAYQQAADGAAGQAGAAYQGQPTQPQAPQAGGSGWGYVPTAAAAAQPQPQPQPQQQPGAAAQGGWFAGGGSGYGAASQTPTQAHPAPFPSTAAPPPPAAQPAATAASSSSPAQSAAGQTEASSPPPRRQPVRRGRALVTAAAAGSAAAAAAASAGGAGAPAAAPGASPSAAADAEGEAAAEALAAAAQDPGMLPVAHAKKPSMDLLGLGASNPPSRTGSATPATFAQAHGADWATSRLSQGAQAAAPVQTTAQAPVPVPAAVQNEFEWANWGQPQQPTAAQAPAQAQAPVQAPQPLQTVASSSTPPPPVAASVAHSSASAPSPPPSAHSASSGAPAQPQAPKGAPSPLDLLAGLTVPAAYDATPVQPQAPAPQAQPHAWNAAPAPLAQPHAWNAAPTPQAPSWSAAPPTDAFAALTVSSPAPPPPTQQQQQQQQAPAAQSSWQTGWGAPSASAAPAASPQPWIKPAAAPAAPAQPAYASHAPPALNGWSSSGIATVPSATPTASVSTPIPAPAPAATAWGTVAGAPSPSSWGVVGSPTAGQPGSASWGLAPPPTHSQAAPVAPGFFSAPPQERPDALSKTAGTHDPFAALTGLSP